MVQLNLKSMTRGLRLRTMMANHGKSLKKNQSKDRNYTQGWMPAPLPAKSKNNKNDENSLAEEKEGINNVATKSNDDHPMGENDSTKGMTTGGEVSDIPLTGFTTASDPPINNSKRTNNNKNLKSITTSQKNNRLPPLKQSPFEFTYTEKRSHPNDSVEVKPEVINETIIEHHVLDNESTKLLKSIIIKGGNNNIKNEADQAAYQYPLPGEVEEDSKDLYDEIAKEQPELAPILMNMILSHETLSKQLATFIKCPEKRFELVQDAINQLKDEGQYELLMENGRAQLVADNKEEEEQYEEEQYVTVEEEEEVVEQQMKEQQVQLDKAIQESKNNIWKVVETKKKTTNHKGEFSPDTKVNYKKVKNHYEILNDDNNNDVANSEEQHRWVATDIITKILIEVLPKHEVDKICKVLREDYSAITLVSWLENMGEFTKAISLLQSKLGHPNEFHPTNIPHETQEDIQRLQLLCNVPPTEVSILGNVQEDYPMEIRGGGSESTDDDEKEKEKKAKKEKKRKKKKKKKSHHRYSKLQEETINADNRKLQEDATSTPPTQSVKKSEKTQQSLSSHLTINSKIKLTGKSCPPHRGKAEEDPNNNISSQVSSLIREKVGAGQSRTTISARQVSKIPGEIEQVQVLMTIIYHLAINNGWVAGNIDDLHTQIAQEFQFYSTNKLIEFVHNISNLKQRVIHARFAQHSNSEGMVVPLGAVQLYEGDEVINAAKGDRVAMFKLLAKFLRRVSVFGEKEVLPKILELTNEMILNLISTPGALMQYVATHFPSIKYSPPVVVRKDMMTLNEPITDENRGAVAAFPNLALRLTEEGVRTNPQIQGKPGTLEPYLEQQMALFFRTAFPWSKLTMSVHYKDLSMKDKWACIFKKGAFITIFRVNYPFLDTNHHPETPPSNGNDNSNANMSSGNNNNSGSRNSMISSGSSNTNSNNNNNNNNNNQQRPGSNNNNNNQQRTTNNGGYHYRPPTPNGTGYSFTNNSWSNQYTEDPSQSMTNGARPGYGRSPYGPGTTNQPSQASGTNGPQGNRNTGFVPVNLTSPKSQDSMIGPTNMVYELTVRRTGEDSNARVSILKNIVFAIEAVQKTVRQNEGYFLIIPHSSAPKSTPSLTKAILLSENNQGHYLFNAQTNYYTNEGMATITVVSNCDITKLTGGGGPVFRGASRKFLDIMANSGPQCQVQVKGVREYEYCPTVMAVNSSSCQDQHRAITEILDHVAIQGQVQVGPEDFKIVYEQISTMSPSGPVIVQASVIHVMSSKSAQVASILINRATPTNPLTNPVTYNWTFRDIRESNARANAIKEQKKYYDERIQIVIEKVPARADLMAAQVYSIDDGKMITFEQVITSGQTIATNNGVSVPSPFITLSKGLVEGTYILEALARNEGLVSNNMRMMIGFMQQCFPNTNLQNTIAHLRPLQPRIVRDVHNNPYPQYNEMETGELNPAYVPRSGLTPSHSRTEAITGNTPGGTLTHDISSKSSSQKPRQQQNSRGRNIRRARSSRSSRSITSSISDAQSDLKRKGKIWELEQALSKRNKKVDKLEEQVKS